MSNDDTLTRVEAGLWQALSQGKRPLGLLLGAGCGVAVRLPADDSPLIPDIAGMTAHVTKSIAETESTGDLTQLVSALTNDLGAAPNVEDMLTRLRTLQTVVGAESVRGLTGAAIDSLEEAIVAEIATLVTVSLPTESTPFDHVARWAGGVQRVLPVEIFTTNYDLLMEQGLERARVPFFDGFVGGREPFFDIRTIEEDDLPSRWVRLWKLHGSVHWTLRGHEVLRISGDDSSSRPMIHPSHLKYEQSRRMPYLVMQDRVRAFLRQPAATLVTSGYSFGDAHVNELVGQGLQSNPTAVVFALIHGTAAENAPAVEFAGTHSNLCLVARDGGIINGEQLPWGDGVECQLGDFATLGQRLRDLGGWRDGADDVGT